MKNFFAIKIAIGLTFCRLREYISWEVLLILLLLLLLSSTEGRWLTSNKVLVAGWFLERG